MFVEAFRNVGEKCSRGVHTSDNKFPPSSPTTISTDTDESKQHYACGIISHDADQSILSNTFESQFCAPGKKVTSDTDADYYRMKRISRKGLKDHPCKIEFQLVKQDLQQKSKSLHNNNRSIPFNRNKCRCAYEKKQQQHQQHQQYQQPQQQQANHQLNDADDNHGEINKECKQKLQPQSVKSKIRNIFTWFNQKQSSTKFNNDRFDGVQDDAENAEIYYFDHGSPLFYRTTDCPPHLISELIAQRTTYHATRFWAELFGSINIGVTFIVTFFLQFYRFLLYSIFRAIIVGILQITSDYLFKPLLAVLFNGLLQPHFIFCQNIFHSICNMLNPITKLIGNILRPFTECIRAMRLVEVKNVNKITKQKEAPMSQLQFQTFQGQSMV
ncbi:unnamed protein product [Diamesa serratosioi]